MRDLLCWYWGRERKAWWGFFWFLFVLYRSQKRPSLPTIYFISPCNWRDLVPNLLFWFTFLPQKLMGQSSSKKAGSWSSPRRPQNAICYTYNLPSHWYTIFPSSSQVPYTPDSARSSAFCIVLISRLVLVMVLVSVANLLTLHAIWAQKVSLFDVSTCRAVVEICHILQCLSCHLPMSLFHMWSLFLRYGA